MGAFLDKLLAEGFTAFGKIQFQTHPPATTALDCRYAMTMVKPGDIVLRKYDYYADKFLIPGEYTHSGIVERGESLSVEELASHPATVMHAVAEGVSRIDFLDFIKDTTGFALLRPDCDTTKMIEFGRMQLGKPYDFHFNVEADLKKISAFFCHKFTAACLSAGGLGIIPILKTIGPVTHEVFLADQFLENPRIKTLLRI